MTEPAENVEGWTKVISDAIAKADLMIAPTSALPETAAAAVAVAKRNAVRARRDALVAIARDIPEPTDFARHLPLGVVTALRNARIRNGGCYQASVEWAAALRSYSLVEYGGRCLTAFGIAVRRELMADDE